MAFEFKKAFQKATELRSLTFAQQWTMTDDSVFNSEQPAMASGIDFLFFSYEVLLQQDPDSRQNLKLMGRFSVV